MRLHGINRDIWDRFTSVKSSWEYDVVEPGFKYNMPDLNAAIGLAQLEQAEYLRAGRQLCAEYYFQELSDLIAVDLPVCYGPYENHSWHIFPLVIRPEASISRNEFIEKMSNEGIGVSVHYKPIHRMTYYKQAYKLDPINYPNAERIWKGTVSLPIYSDLKEEGLKYVCQTVKLLLDKRLNYFFFPKETARVQLSTK
jgi:dTDP-4-amino-4,6-dideoxygalactose transaminase